MQKEDDVRKVVVVGAAKAGKTSLLTQLTQFTFTENYTPTKDGMEFVTKNVNVAGQESKLQIWDASGTYLKGKDHLSNIYFRGATAVLFVYDVTNRQSFEEVQALWETVEPQLASLGTQGKDYVAILVGTKIDLSDKRVVTLEEAQEFADGKFTLVQEASAKNSDSVNQVFTEVAKITPAPRKLSVTHDDAAPPVISKFDGKLQALIDELSRNKNLCGCSLSNANKDRQGKQIDGLVALKAALLVPGAKPADAIEKVKIDHPDIQHNRKVTALLKQILASAPPVEEQLQSSSAQVM